MLEEEPARREDQTGNIESILTEKKLFFKNLSGIEYGGAEEAEKYES